MAEQQRTAAIIATVTKHLADRRALLDRADDLGEVVITVRMLAGTTTIKSTSISEEHVNRRLA